MKQTTEELLSRLARPQPRRKGMSVSDVAAEQAREKATAALVAEVKKTEELRSLRA